MCKQLAEEDSNMQSETVPEDMTVSDYSSNKKKAGRLNSTTITPTKDLSPDLKKMGILYRCDVAPSKCRF